MNPKKELLRGLRVGLRVHGSRASWLRELGLRVSQVQGSRCRIYWTSLARWNRGLGFRVWGILDYSRRLYKYSWDLGGRRLQNTTSSVSRYGSYP